MEYSCLCQCVTCAVIAVVVDDVAVIFISFPATQAPVPLELDGGTYEDVVVNFIRHHKALTLGLYRAAGSNGYIAPFVHTNPRPDTPVTCRDLVFYIA